MHSLIIVVISFSLFLGTVVYCYPTKIIGGYDADIKDYPYQLSLQVDHSHKCGASLIKENVALTSANCLKGIPQSKVSLVGGVTFLSDIHNHFKQERNVLSVCINTSSILADYNVALLLLSEPFKLVPKRVEIIELQPVNTVVPGGLTGIVAGWGSTGRISNFSDRLQATQVPKVSNNDCKAIHTSLYSYLPLYTSCYGHVNGESNICTADIGGALVINKKQVGIASKVFACENINAPGIYIQLEKTQIRDKIENCLDNFIQHVTTISPETTPKETSTSTGTTTTDLSTKTKTTKLLTSTGTTTTELSTSTETETTESSTSAETATTELSISTETATTEISKSSETEITEASTTIPTSTTELSTLPETKTTEFLTSAQTKTTELLTSTEIKTTDSLMSTETATAELLRDTTASEYVTYEIFEI